jgi:hypothetical protein
VPLLLLVLLLVLNEAMLMLLDTPRKNGARIDNGRRAKRVAGKHSTQQEVSKRICSGLEGRQMRA